jgi:hypothetical protein
MSSTHPLHHRLFLLLSVFALLVCRCDAQDSSSTGSNVNSYGVTTGLCGYREFRFDWLATYDLVSASVDDSYGGPYQLFYYFRACGNVTAPACAAIEGTSTSPMVCQYTIGGTAVSLGYYVQSQAYWSIPSAGVVQMYMADGTLCGTTPRAIIVQFVCNSSLTGYPTNFTVVETSTACLYSLQVQTSFACGAVPDSSSVSSSVGDLSQCGYAGFNLSSLALLPYDLSAYVIDNSYGGPYFVYYYLHPCGVVVAPDCAGPLANLAPMACQNTVGGSAIDVAVYRPSLTTWTVLSNGIQSSIKDGTTCSNGFERTLIVQYICNATLTLQTTLNFTVTADSTCTYTFVVPTNLTCGTPTILYIPPSSSSSTAGGGPVAGSSAGTGGSVNSYGVTTGQPRQALSLRQASVAVPVGPTLTPRPPLPASVTPIRLCSEWCWAWVCHSYCCCAIFCCCATEERRTRTSRRHRPHRAMIHRRLR